MSARKQYDSQQKHYSNTTTPTGSSRAIAEKVVKHTNEFNVLQTVRKNSRQHKKVEPTSSHKKTIKEKTKETIQMPSLSKSDVTPRSILESIFNKKDAMNTIKPEKKRRKLTTPSTSRNSMNKSQRITPAQSRTQTDSKASHPYNSRQVESPESLHSRHRESHSDLPVPMKKRKKSMDIREKLKPVADAESLREELFEKILHLRQTKNIETSRRSLLEAISKSSKVSEHDSAPNDSSFGFENQEDSPKKPTPPHVANGSSYNSSGGNVTDSTEHTAILTSGVKLLTRKSIREPSVVSSGPSAELQTTKENQTDLVDPSSRSLVVILTSSTEKSLTVASEHHSNYVDANVSRENVSEVVLSSEVDTTSDQDPLQLHNSFPQDHEESDEDFQNQSELFSTRVQNSRGSASKNEATPSSNAIPTNIEARRDHQQKKLSKKIVPTLNKFHPVKRKPAPSSATFVSHSQMKGILEHYSSLKFTRDAVAEADKIFKSFFKHLCLDMAAMSDLAGRSTINRSDLELIMKRQRLVSKKRPLHILIEEALPLEYREKLLPCAKASLDDL